MSPTFGLLLEVCQELLISLCDQVQTAGLPFDFYEALDLVEKFLFMLAEGMHFFDALWNVEALLLLSRGDGLGEERDDVLIWASQIGVSIDL